jgi:hypothetical protein
VHPAARYDAADGLCIVTAYFNPVGYRSRRRNYAAFRRAMIASGLQLTTIECAFGDAAFELSGPDVIQVRGRHVLWQKERLLNLAIARLPPDCRAVAWLDGDVFFENPAWAAEAMRRLDEHALVQPFDTVVRPPRARRVGNRDTACPGFAAVYARHPERLRSGRHDLHGETGFAWVARRDVLATGLYDASVVGGGDHLIAHAMGGDWQSPCVALLAGNDTPLQRHFRAWGERFYARVQGRIGFVAGAVLPLWHGDLARRDYTDRHRIIEDSRLNPAADLRVNDAGCWEWSSDKPELHRWVAGYFVRRDEDRRDAGTKRHSENGRAAVTGSGTARRSG